MPPAGPGFQVSLPTSNAFSALASNNSSATDLASTNAALDERLALAFRLIDAVLEHDDHLVRTLVEQERADCWVQDQQGWTALHAAAYTGNVDHVNLLLRKGNAVWALTDNLGCTAGDIAFSMNHNEAYEALLGEGVRAEMLRAVLEATQEQSDSENGQEETAEPVASTSGTRPDQEDDVPMREEADDNHDDGSGPTTLPLSTASDNATFLSSRLVFTHDAAGQPVALDAEGNGVMMGWERPIMARTVERCCEPGWADRKGRSAVELHAEEIEEDREPLRVMNVGFGLGIVDSFLQEYSPTSHLIIEPHPDVLAFARENGWYDKPGVRFYEGTWKQFFKDLESGKEEYLGWDVVYFDTYSEHYSDLHAFFGALPDLLSISDSARFSFFHGLGATSRLLYDVYTTVSELHLREIGLETEWDQVDVSGTAGGRGGADAVERWSSTGLKGRDVQGGGGTEAPAAAPAEEEEKKYWREEMVGQYRLPICRLGM